MRWSFGRRGVAPVLAVAVLASLVAVTGGSAAAAEPAPVIEIGDPASEVLASIQIIDATRRSVEDGGDSGSGPATGLQPPGTAEPLYVPADLVTDTSWTTEVASVPDRTTDPKTNLVTPRTSVMYESAIAAGLTSLSSLECVSGRASNPNSDHPGGRGCDLMFNPKTDAGVTAGWRAANWLVANQAALGVKYVIWQGMIWNARSKPGPWTVYTSTAYGCPNPANLTGCHYDHVHVSMY